MRTIICICLCQIFVIISNAQNSSLHFDGSDDHLALINLPVSATYSFEAWIKPESSNSDMRITSANTTSSSDPFALRWHFDAFDFWTGTSWVNIVDNLTVDTWYHVALSRESSTEIKAYVNGVLESTITIQSDVQFVDLSTLGSPYASGSNSFGKYFEGKLDEVRIWEGPLSATDISSRMNLELVGDEVDLVAYYKFDDSSSIYDIVDCSPNLNHATRLGTSGTNNLPQYDTDIPSGITDAACGIDYNNSLDFDGTDDYADLDNIPSSFTYSVEMWLNLTSVSSNDRILSAQSSHNDIYGIYIDNNQKLCISTGGTPQPVSANPLQSNTWYHIAYIRKSPTEVDFYINGINEVGTITVTSSIEFVDKQTLCQPFMQTGTSWGNYAEAKIDEFRIWNGPRSQTEIQSLMNTELNGAENGLVAYYKFDDFNSVHDIEDCTINAYHSTRVGASGNNNLPQFNTDTPSPLTDVSCAAQNCPAGNTVLNNQSDIDLYVSTYGTCSVHNGNLTINGSVSDVSALNFITEITGNLTFNANNNLTSLTGFENLEKVGGSLAFNHLDAITDFSGFDGMKLDSIDGSFRITNCNLITEFSAFRGLRHVGSTLTIEDNIALTSLSGLDSLRTIGYRMYIDNNDALPNLNGIENITNVANWAYIFGNAQLVDCSALCVPYDNGAINYLSVYSNPSECSSQNEVIINCVSDSCYVGNLSLTTQLEIDAYVANFNTCTVHDGNLTISGSISDISGLSFLEEVTGHLTFQNNSVLSSLTGMDNIKTIGGNLNITNMGGLSDVSGLNGTQLDTIGGTLTIKDCGSMVHFDDLSGLSYVGSSISIRGNSSLISLQGFDQLDVIGYRLTIQSNNSLSTLSGIEGISQIANRFDLYFNNALTDCSAMCTLIDNGATSNFQVYGNPSECSSLDEIVINCQFDPCYVGNINLNSQAEVDAYVDHYSYCTIHDGNLEISGSVTDISGLSFLEEVTGGLAIRYNSVLTSLDGLQNIHTIGTSLTISDVDGLTDLSGIDGAQIQTLHNGSLTVEDCSGLVQIDALNGIQHVGSTVRVESNSSLANLNGLSQLQTVGYRLFVSSNPTITNLIGIENLLDVGNFSYFNNNSNLTDCSVICDLSDNGVFSGVSVYNNPSDCSSYDEIILNCQFDSCFVGNMNLSTQAEVDAYVANYSNCDTHDGNLNISGSVSDISGLNFLQIITGSLTIGSSNSLTDLTGFENIHTIGGSLVIQNLDAITSINALDGALIGSLNSSLVIKDCNLLEEFSVLDGIDYVGANVIVENNPALISLSGLNTLNNISGYLEIDNNDALIDLVGLENVFEVGGILAIRNNAVLSDCSALCPMILSGGPNGTSIYNNPSFCSNYTEISGQCAGNACAIGDLTVSTQTELDDFVTNYSSCDSLYGSLHITGTVNDISALGFMDFLSVDLRIYNNNSLTDLSGFAGLEVIDDLIIDNNSALTALTGIDQINFNGDLVIEDCANLPSISELSYLTSITGSLRLYNLDMLPNLMGVQNITSVGGGLTIQQSAMLIDCSAICDLINNDGVNGTIGISSNPSECSSVSEVSLVCTPAGCPAQDLILSTQIDVDAFIQAYGSCPEFYGNLEIRTNNVTDISGLNFLTEIHGDFELNNLDEISDFSGLGNLDSIFGNLELIGNDSLLNLNFLSNVEGFDQKLVLNDNSILNDISELSTWIQFVDVTIINNDSLQNLSGLENITFIQNNLTVQNNMSLTDCSALCTLIDNNAVAGAYSIAGNPSECTSLNEITIYCSSGACPMSNVTLANQAEVDAFANIYSSCDTIFGDLRITGSTITDISGLAMITHVEGDLDLMHLSSLSSLTGLENILKVEGELYFHDNDALSDLTGLSNIEFGDDLRIQYSGGLVNLNGLSSIDTVLGNLVIQKNHGLLSLSGLAQLKHVSGALSISDNDALLDLNNLNSLQTVGSNLTVSGNAVLSDCGQLCSIINNGGVQGSSYISNNPSQCSSLTELTALCAVTDCPEAAVVLSSQIDVDAFVAAFSGCDSLPDNLTISGSNAIVDLSALSFITHIEGNLQIQSTHQITDLAGFENLISINGDFRINGNDNLESLAHLSLLSYVGGDLRIYGNDSLVNVNGMVELDTVFGDLKIHDNPFLSDCSGICDLINSASIIGDLDVYNNPTGCSSENELMTLCSNSTCPSGDVTLNTQTEVDAFVVAFNGCDSLPGNLMINGTNMITDLSGLSFIEYVNGSVTIQNTHLISTLSGFQSLTEINGSLKLVNNDLLLDLDSLHQLSVINGELSIQHNDALIQVDSLVDISLIQSNLLVKNNSALSDCEGLCNIINNNIVGGNSIITGNPSQCSSLTELTMFCSPYECPIDNVTLYNQIEVDAFVSQFATCDSLSGDLIISGGNNITDLSGLSFVTYVAGDLKFINNYLIQDLDGFQNVTGVGGDLIIENNINLDSIPQLSNLLTVGNALEIYSNDSLQLLGGLEQLMSIGSDLDISYNLKLDDCLAICNIIQNAGIGGQLNISNNANSCNSENELVAICQYGSAISEVFIENLPDTIIEGTTFSFDVSVDYAPVEDLFVNIYCDNDIEVPMPDTVKILAGLTTTQVTISIPDDTEPEENEIIGITVGAPYLDGTIGYTLLSDDGDIPAFTFEIVQDTISESAGIYATQGIVTRVIDDSTDLTVLLEEYPYSDLIIPSGVHLEPDELSKSFYIGALDNAQSEGERKTFIDAKYWIPSCNCAASATSLGYGIDSLVITDNDGPSLNLLVNPLSMQEGLSNAGILTVSRNTDTSADLIVSLSNNDPTELTLPATITIPAGQTSIDVPIGTIEDNIPDGNQNVSITASHAGFNSGASWALVTDINKPDFKISHIHTPIDMVHPGENFDIRAYVINEGLSTAPTGVLLKAYLSDDDIIDENDFDLGEMLLEYPIEVGDTLELPDLLQAPAQPGVYNLLLQVNYNNELTETNYLNNVSAPSTFTVLADYSGNAFTDIVYTMRGTQEVVIHGKSILPDGSVIPNVDLEVYVENNVLSRTEIVQTDSLGCYELTFDLLDNEIGHFELGARYPNAGTQVMTDTFEVIGLKLNAGNKITWDLMQNEPDTGYILVENLNDTTYSEVTFDTTILPFGCNVSFDTIATLSPFILDSIQYIIESSEVSNIQGYDNLEFNVISAEFGVIQDEEARYFCQAQQGYIRSDITSIDAKYYKDTTRIIEFALFNEGIGTTDVEILTPAVDWMMVKSQTLISGVETGDTAYVVLELLPSENLPLNTPATGTIVVNALNGNSITIPFTVEKVSTQTGALTVDAVDQYTYFTEEAPHVENAEVTISHYFTGQVLAQGTTNAQGLITFSNLPEGNHRLVVESDKHRGYDGPVYVNPGDSITEIVFLDYQAITFSWEVFPTTIEDEYLVNLNMEFETNVPKPVVIIEMPDTMPQLLGNETFDFYATLTNVGLITAEEVQLTLPQDHPTYEWVTNYVPQDISAQQSIQIPVQMRVKGFGNISDSDPDIYGKVADHLGISGPSLKNSGDCVEFTLVAYTYECVDGLWEATAKQIFVLGEICPGNFTGGPGIDFPGCSDCSIEIPDIPEIDLPDINIDCDCNACWKDALGAIFGCIPIPIPSKYEKVKDAIDLATSDNTGDVLVYVASKGSLNVPGLKGVAPVGKLIDAFKCGWGIGTVINDCIVDPYFWGPQTSNADKNQILEKSLTSASIPSTLIDPINDLHVIKMYYEAKETQTELYTGSEVFENENYAELLGLTQDSLLQRKKIMPLDSQEVLIYMSVFDIDSTLISNFISRWNQTLDAWNQSVYEPNASFPNIISKSALDDEESLIQDIKTHVGLRGYDSFIDMYEQCLTAVQTYSASDDPTINEVCASVSIEMSQSLTMEREAFQGTLTVFNGSLTDQMTDFSLELEILDNMGVLSNHLFEIVPQTTSNLTAIDGTGMLDPNTEGTATIIFIPEKGAAPTAPQFYSFGGYIEYMDPFTNLMVKLPLIPVTLQVNPSPDLFLHYFMQRDIYGDDPLTNVIEPILPADFAVMVENNGFGVGQNILIESAQPEIVDNDKGLAISFQLVGSKLQGQEKDLGLTTIDFGNINPQIAKVGQWYFTSSLLGHFTSYESNIVHLDSYGNPDLSLVSGTEIHELIKTISVYDTPNDGIEDFLVNDVADINDHPESIYLSQGNQVLDVYPADFGEHTGDIYATGNTTILNVDPLAIGWNYIKLDDPGNGLFELVSVTRDSDGQLIPLTNVWLTHVTIPDGQSPIYESKFHFVDNFASINPETYTVVWSPLDPNPPAVDTIMGHPSMLTSEQVTQLTVRFTEEINPFTFGIEDLNLAFQGGANLIDSTVIISQIDSLTFEVDIATVTTGNGFYVFTVQAAGVEDLTGTPGQVGEQASWTQYMSVPVVDQFIGWPINYSANSFDTVQLLFNMPIDTSTFGVDDISITLDGVVQTGNLTLELLGNNDKLFKLSGLSSFLGSNDEYELNIDLLNISSQDGTNGLSVQTIPLILDTQPPTLINKLLSNSGGIDNQHFVKISLNFSEDIVSLDTSMIALKFNGNNQTIFAHEVVKVADDWYEILWNDTLTIPSGSYEFDLDLTKVYDLAGNQGAGLESEDWIVNRSSALTISNISVSPDLGYDNQDLKTSTNALDVSFDLNEDAWDIQLYQLINGSKVWLNTFASGSMGTHTHNVLFPHWGNSELEIIAHDQFGNFVSATVDMYLDQSTIFGSWDQEDALELVYHPDTLNLYLDEDVFDISTLNDSLLIWNWDNNDLPLSEIVIEKVTAQHYRILGFDDYINEPGVYTFGVGLESFTEYISGLQGSGWATISWTILDLNQRPNADAGVDTVLVYPGLHYLDGSNSSDPDNDSLSYVWYPPLNKPISDSFAIQPSFMITQEDHEEVYTFLLEVDDGKKSHTNQIHVFIELLDSLYLLDEPNSIYCETDTLDIEWDYFGNIELVDILLSSDNGISFPTIIAEDIHVDSMSISYALNGLDGNQFMYQIRNTSASGFVVISQNFEVVKSDSTYLEYLTCDPSLVDTTYQTLANLQGCDSLIVTATILDTIVPVANCVTQLNVDLNIDGTYVLSPADVDNSSSDNCSIQQSLLDQDTFDCSSLGARDVILTVVDNAGNQSSCSTVVVVGDINDYCSCITPVLEIDTLDIPTDIYRAVTIHSSGNVLAANNVEYRASDHILLEPGFEVKQNADFLAIIVDCNIPNGQNAEDEVRGKIYVGLESIEYIIEKGSLILKSNLRHESAFQINNNSSLRILRKFTLNNSEDEFKISLEGIDPEEAIRIISEDGRFDFQIR